jgi:hypothetical protein
MRRLNIVVLGWGSLVWNPGDLLTNGEWSTDGPELPVEFTRISQDHRLTLVLVPGAKLVPVLWTRMNTGNLELAMENLKTREGTSPKNIGFIDLLNNTERSRFIDTREIKHWARKRSINAIIWTDLPSNFESKYKPLDKTNVVLYLDNLEPKAKILAKEYIRKAPSQINTTFRMAIAREFGWATRS